MRRTLKLTHHNLLAMNRNVDMIDVWGSPLCDQPLIVIDLWVVVICEGDAGSLRMRIRGSLLTMRAIEVLIFGCYNFETMGLLLLISSSEKDN